MLDDDLSDWKMAKSTTLIRFEAFFDEEAQVWVARSDRDRMTTEAPTAKTLVEKLPALVLDVLSERTGRRPQGVSVVIDWRGEGAALPTKLLVA